jgi:predicted DNA-binding protein YlxM (UPF0122 family)
MTPKAKQRVHGQSSLKYSIDIYNKVLDLKQQNYMLREIGKELNIPLHTVWNIIQRNVKVLEEIEIDENDQGTQWLDEKLVSKYASKGEYDWLPLYFIQRYNVTHLTAKQIYLQLQALKRKQNHESTRS